MAEVSVIVPVYNASRYLEQCVRSALRQTVPGLEVICVDDGSTDDSVRILRRIQEEDARVRIFRQGNMGAGPARNAGLGHAEGRYVAFLDADDYYLDPDALEVMRRACGENHVRVCGSLRRTLAFGAEREEAVFPEEGEQPAPGSLCRYADCQLDYHYQSFLFERSLLEENGISFPAYRRFQDPPFFVRAMYAAREFWMADRYLYCYRDPAMEYRYSPEKAEDLLRGLNDTLEFAAGHGLERLFRRTLRRMNCDYADIIYWNIGKSRAGALEQLARANRLACGRLGDPGYVLRPLRRLLAAAEADTSGYEARIRERAAGAGRIFVYGAGRMSRAFLAYLEREGLLGRVCGILVSGQDGNPEEMHGIPVGVLERLEPGAEGTVFVAAGWQAQEEIAPALEERGWRDCELLDTEFLARLEREGDRDA